MTGKVFLAGGTGVIGRRVLPALVGAGYEVSVNTRNPQAMDSVRASHAHPITVDLFDANQVAEALAGQDVVINLATCIPTGASAAFKKQWTMNDRLRSVAAKNLATGTPTGARYIGESITFPYEDLGSHWIDESVDRSYSELTKTVLTAEDAARSAAGVTLRFAMFWATDSAHNADLLKAAKLGIFALPGTPDAFASWIHVDDAAAAVVAAIDAPPGTYNVAEPDPRPRHEHMEAIAIALGRNRLRGLPSWTVRLGGPPVEALARSQRISSKTLGNVSGWHPKIRTIDTWRELGS